MKAERGTVNERRRALSSSFRVHASALFALALLLGASEAARACTCGGMPTPRGAYEAAAAVFVGAVTKTDPEPKTDEETGAQVARVRVEEAFKGVAAGEEIVLHQPGHNCAPKFRAGARRLLYVHRHEDQKRWEVFGCNRGGSPESAADDLLYLRALPGSAKRSRISGMLEHYEDGPDRSFSLVRNIAGAKVRIVGEGKTYELVTDPNGVYEIYDLPPGTYSIQPELPFGLKVRFPMTFGEVAEGKEDGDGVVTVRLGVGGMAGSDFILSSDNVITGRILDPQGNPLNRVCLELLSVEKPAGRGSRIFDCTEEGGRYRLDEVPPGRYLLAVNDENKPSGSEPFPTTFYPGVFEREKAGVIVVGEKEQADGYDIHVPRLLPTVEISGQLLYKDGAPVVGEPVSFKTEDEHYEGDGDQTDEQGRFTIRVLKGKAGSLSAKLYIYEGEFVAVCPEVAKIFKDAGRTSAFVEPKPVRLAAETDVAGVKLILPYPSCPLKEKEKN